METGQRPGRRDGWWGIAFVAILVVAGGMVSIPTSSVPVPRIQAFYSAHRTVVILAQALGLVGVVVLLRFAAGLSRGATRPRPMASWIFGTAVLVAVCEVATSVPPLWLALASTPSTELTGTLTTAADLTDAALFAAIAIFATVLAVQLRPDWLRMLSLLVALLTVVRAVISPLGAAALDAVAPLAFLLLILVLSVRLLRGTPLFETA